MMARGMTRLQGCPFRPHALNNCKTRLLVLPHLSLQEPRSGYMEPPLRHRPGLLKLTTSARIYLLSKLPTEVSTCHRCTGTDWCKESRCETSRNWGENLCETSGFNCAFCNCSSCLKKTPPSSPIPDTDLILNHIIPAEISTDHEVGPMGTAGFTQHSPGNVTLQVITVLVMLVNL